MCHISPRNSQTPVQIDCAKLTKPPPNLSTIPSNCRTPTRLLLTFSRDSDNISPNTMLINGPAFRKHKYPFKLAGNGRDKTKNAQSWDRRLQLIILIAVCTSPYMMDLLSCDNGEKLNGLPCAWQRTLRHCCGTIYFVKCENARTHFV